MNHVIPRRVVYVSGNNRPDAGGDDDTTKGEEMTNDEVNRRIAELRHEVGNVYLHHAKGLLLEKVREYYPLYTDNWKLAGMLLDELVAKYPISILKMDDGEYWVADHMEKFNGFEHSLTEAIARAWLAWKE